MWCLQYLGESVDFFLKKLASNNENCFVERHDECLIRETTKITGSSEQLVWIVDVGDAHVDLLKQDASDGCIYM